MLAHTAEAVKALHRGGRVNDKEKCMTETIEIRSDVPVAADVDVRRYGRNDGLGFAPCR